MFSVFDQYLWINKQSERYYRVIVGVDLLGDLQLIRAWGSLNSDHKGELVEIGMAQPDITALLHKIYKERKKRGYVCLNDASSVSD